MRTTYPYILLIILLFTFNSCNTKEAVDVVEEDDQAVPQEMLSSFRSKNAKVKNLLKGKTSLNLNDLLEKNEITDSKIIILYYSSIDCSSCIETGLDLLSRVEKVNQIESAIVLSGVYYENGPLSMMSGFIHDETAEIQTELGYILTPSLLFYDKEDGILNFYMIPTFKDEKGLNDFEKSLAN